MVRQVLDFCPKPSVCDDCAHRQKSTSPELRIVKRGCCFGAIARTSRVFSGEYSSGRSLAPGQNCDNFELLLRQPIPEPQQITHEHTHGCHRVSSTDVALLSRDSFQPWTWLNVHARMIDIRFHQIQRCSLRVLN